MIEVMKELQQVRQESQIFAGKHGFITTRDLLVGKQATSNGERIGGTWFHVTWEGYVEK